MIIPLPLNLNPPIFVFFMALNQPTYQDDDKSFHVGYNEEQETIIKIYKSHCIIKSFCCVDRKSVV